MGFFVAMVETIKGVFLKPGELFALMRREHGVGDALLFTVSLQVFTFLWVFAVGGADPGAVLPPDFRETYDLPANFNQIMVILYPVSIILMLFLVSFSLHQALKLRNLQRYSYSLIFRMMAYAGGSASMLLIIPVIGGLLSMAMNFYVVFRGIQTLYGTTPGGFVLLVLISLLVLVGLYVAFFAVLFVLALIGVMLV